MKGDTTLFQMGTTEMINFNLGYLPRWLAEEKSQRDMTCVEFFKQLKEEYFQKV